MRRPLSTAVFAAGFSAALLIIAGTVQGIADGRKPAPLNHPVHVHIEAGSAGFAPDTVRLAAGHPADLVFTRTVASGCMAEVHIPDLGVPKTALPQGVAVTIRIQPMEPGAYQFRCGMDMRRGTIIVSGNP